MHAKNITGIDRTYIVEKQDNSNTLKTSVIPRTSPPVLPYIKRHNFLYVIYGPVLDYHFIWILLQINLSLFLSFSLFLSHSLSRSLRGGKKTLKINIMPIEIKRLKIENNYYRPHDSDTFYKIQVLP